MGPKLELLKDNPKLHEKGTTFTFSPIENVECFFRGEFSQLF
jgi:hypothetical protein